LKLEFSLLKHINLPNAFAADKFQRLKENLLAKMMRQKDKLFIESHDPDGNAWAPLSKGHANKMRKKNLKAALKKKSTKRSFTNQETGEIDVVGYKEEINKQANSHQILRNTGALMNSLSRKGAADSINTTAGNEVVLGTNIEYANILNFGGTINMPENKNGFGKNILVPAHKVTIVARPFIGFGRPDNEEINEAINFHVSKIVKGGGK
jgi:phage gpG-like protein